MSAALEIEIKRLNKNLERFFSSVMQAALPKPTEWLTYEQAFEIMPRSKKWYQEARRSGMLVENADWKRRGKEIIYRAASIEQLSKGNSN